MLEIERYPDWWTDFRRVRVVRGDAKSVGSVIACEVRGPLPFSLNYSLEVLEVQQYRHVLLRSSGDLVGIGRWAFTEARPGVSTADYFWDVATTNPVLNLIAPLARRAMARNHERVMANGYAALRPHIEGPAG